MTFDEARKLVRHEALGAGGALDLVRGGEDPGRPRMAALRDTLRTLGDTLRGREQIERELAHALFLLAYDLDRQINGWVERAPAHEQARWEDLAEDAFQVAGAVERILRDDSGE